eukprot:10977400-Heterocapsa_arctica.AAC.1
MGAAQQAGERDGWRYGKGAGQGESSNLFETSTSKGKWSTQEGPGGKNAAQQNGDEEPGRYGKGAEQGGVPNQVWAAAGWTDRQKQDPGPNRG